MKAITYKRFGSVNVLRLEDVKKPIPSEDQVLVRVHATTVNSGDCHLRSGKPFMARLFAGPLVPRQKILGSTYSGTIEALGSKVEGFQLGDQVFGSLGIQSGSHAEYIKVEATSIMKKKPSHLSHEEAASLVFGSLSGKYFLDRANISKKAKVLIIGAGGGVGAYATQYAKSLGAFVTGMCSGESADFVRSLGADQIIDYRQEALSNYRGAFDIILDMVGREKLSVIDKALTDKGRYVTTVARLDLMVKKIFARKKSKAYIFDIDKSKAEDLESLIDLVNKKTLRPLIDQVFKIDQVQEAHLRVEASNKRGAVVVTMT